MNVAGASSWRTALTQSFLHTNGFVHLPRVISGSFHSFTHSPPLSSLLTIALCTCSEDVVVAMQRRCDALFDGGYETGVYPDEIHYRKGVSKESAMRELNNVWKSDLLIKSVALSPLFGDIACSLMGWKQARMAQGTV